MPKLRKQTGRYQVRKAVGGWFHIMAPADRRITWDTGWEVVDTEADRIVLNSDRMGVAQQYADGYNAGEPVPTTKQYARGIRTRRS